MTAGLPLLPLLLGLGGWVPFVIALRRRGRVAALTAAASWAVVLALGLPVAERLRPGLLARAVVGAGPYAAEMVRWATTGDGCESDPGCFLPRHAVHAGGFAAATALTGGLGGLVLAAVLFGWMGAYAAALAALARVPAVAVLAAWHPWAVVRVGAFLALGVALAEPLACRGLPRRPGRGRWLAAGLAGLLLDAALKAALAPWWWAHVIRPLLR